MIFGKKCFLCKDKLDEQSSVLSYGTNHVKQGQVELCSKCTEYVEQHAMERESNTDE